MTELTLPINKYLSKNINIFIGFFLFSILILYWVPDGFGIPPTYEEWAALFEAKFNGFASAFAVYGPERPLLGLPSVLGHYISPGSFFGLNILQFIFILASGLFLHAILMRLFGDGLFAFFAVAIFLVFPSDAGRYTLRVLPLHGSVAISLAAAYLAIRATTAVRSWPIVISFMFCQAVAFGIYNSGVILMLLFSLVLYWWAARVRDRDRTIALWWAFLPLITLSILVFNAIFGVAYQSGMLDRERVSSHNFLLSALKSLLEAYWRLYIEGWSLFKGYWQGDSSHLILSFICLLICALAAAILIRNRQKYNQKISRTFLAIAFFASVLAGVAYSVFIPTYWSESNWRVFIYATVGASISVTAVLRAIAGDSFSGRLVFCVLCTALVLAGFNSSSAQQNYYASAGNAQVSAVRSILGLASNDFTKRVVVITPNSRGLFEIFSTCTWVGDCLNQSANYIKDASPRREYYACSLGGSLRESCSFQAAGIDISRGSPWHGLKQPNVFIPYQGTDILFFGNGEVSRISDINSPPRLVTYSGFYDWEGGRDDGHVWSSGTGQLLVFNPGRFSRELKVSFGLGAISGRRVQFRLNGGDAHSFLLTENKLAAEFSDTFITAPGLNIFLVNTDAPPIIPKSDPRALSFFLSKLRVEWVNAVDQK